MIANRVALLGGPIVPWEGDLDTLVIGEFAYSDEKDTLDSFDPMDVMRVAQRVLLREMVRDGLATVLMYINDSDSFDLSVTVLGDLELGDWENECRWTPIWQWWPEFQLDENTLVGDPNFEADESEERWLFVESWNDRMEYASFSPTVVKWIVGTVSPLRTPGQPGAADVLLTLMAAHPKTPRAFIAPFVDDEWGPLREAARRASS